MFPQILLVITGLRKFCFLLKIEAAIKLHSQVPSKTGLMWLNKRPAEGRIYLIMFCKPCNLMKQPVMKKKSHTVLKDDISLDLDVELECFYSLSTFLALE